MYSAAWTIVRRLAARIPNVSSIIFCQWRHRYPSAGVSIRREMAIVSCPFKCCLNCEKKTKTFMQLLLRSNNSPFIVVSDVALDFRRLGPHAVLCDRKTTWALMLRMRSSFFLAAQLAAVHRRSANFVDIYGWWLQAFLPVSKRLFTMRRPSVCIKHLNHAFRYTKDAVDLKSHTVSMASRINRRDFSVAKQIFFVYSATSRSRSTFRQLFVDCDICIYAAVVWKVRNDAWKASKTFRFGVYFDNALFGEFHSWWKM